MRKTIALSGVALTVVLLTIGPVNAVSLEVGGDGGLISLGGSDGSSAGVSVDADIGGGSDASLDVDANLGGGDGDGTIDLFGGKKKLVTTGGDNLLTVDTSDDADALVTLFGTDDESVDVDLGGGSGDGVSVSLFGSSGDGDDAVKADLLGADETAYVNLFGTGGTGGGGSEDVVSSGPLGERTFAIFGPSEDRASDGGVDNTQTGSVASGSAGTGAGAGAGGNGQIGDDGIVAPTPMPARIVPRPATRVATNANVRAGSACFSPDAQQIAHLRSRVTYSGELAASWKSAASINIVPINLCPEAKQRLAAAIDADANIDYLQSAVAADARLNASLDPSYDPEDVLAVDQAGEDLTVYVY